MNISAIDFTITIAITFIIIIIIIIYYYVFVLSCSIQVDDCKLPVSREDYDCILYKAIIKIAYSTGRCYAVKFLKRASHSR